MRLKDGVPFSFANVLENANIFDAVEFTGTYMYRYYYSRPRVLVKKNYGFTRVKIHVIPRRSLLGSLSEIFNLILTGYTYKLDLLFAT